MRSKEKIKYKKSYEDKMKEYWRPMMAWQYAFICMFDFFVAPILNAIFFAKTGINFVQWNPLTLQGGGLYHISMGAIIGVTAWSRGQEKLINAELQNTGSPRININYNNSNNNVDPPPKSGPFK